MRRKKDKKKLSQKSRNYEERSKAQMIMLHDDGYNHVVAL